MIAYRAIALITTKKLHFYSFPTLISLFTNDCINYWHGNSGIFSTKMRSSLVDGNSMPTINVDIFQNADTFVFPDVVLSHLMGMSGFNLSPIRIEMITEVLKQQIYKIFTVIYVKKNI